MFLIPEYLIRSGIEVWELTIRTLAFLLQRASRQFPLAILAVAICFQTALKLLQAQPRQNTLTREEFNDQGNEEANHCSPAVKTFCVVVEAKFWFVKLRSCGGLGLGHDGLPLVYEWLQFFTILACLTEIDSFLPV